jgi:dTDP-4-dehydrorhamnose 3,5-epimerase
MDHRRLDIPDIILFTARRHGDARGFFSETFRQDLFEAVAGPTVFLQDNHSLSSEAGTIRGLHFQTPPKVQGKLVRVVRGAILDVAVDLRIGSPNFGRHVSATLSSVNWQQLWVPAGFAHGFCTLEPETEVIYKVTEYYSPDHDRGIIFNDPTLSIDWPVNGHSAIVSEKDGRHPTFADLQPWFRFRP